jgi:hypothetical protein
MVNKLSAGNTMEPRKQPNNVNGTPIIASSDSLPENLARIFHPSLKGMTAYRDAIVNAYKVYKAVATPRLSAGPKPTPTPGNTGGNSGVQQPLTRRPPICW